VQVSHYSPADLENRIADIRQRQQPLRDRIAAVVEKRQSLDEVLMDLNHRQYLIGRALSNTEKKAHADELETHIRRFDEIDHGGPPNRANRNSETLSCASCIAVEQGIAGKLGY
jgi:chromosome segregation ATPase